MLEAIDQIHWKEVLLVLMGSGITILLFLYRVVQDYLKKYKFVTPLLGTWYTYHISRARYNVILRKEKWNIHRRLTGITIKTSDDERSLLKYKGRVSFDSGHTILFLEGTDHPETTQYRLTMPIPSEDTIMLGFHIAKDFDHELYSTIKLVCKNKRTDDEAKKILSSSIEWFKEELCIRLSKKPIESNKVDI